MMGWRRRLGCVLAAVLVGAAGLDPVIEAKTKAFLGRPDQIEAVREALVAQVASIPFVCTGLTLSPPALLIDQPLPRFDADGTMVEGRVQQRFVGGGCGSLRLLLNIWLIAKPGEATRAVAAYPGTTGAAVDLQQAATPTATVAAGRVIGGCGSLDVIDTTDIGLDTPAGRGSGAWREVWLVSGCGRFAQVLLHFVPDKAGGRTRVEVPPDGVRGLDLR